MFLASGCSKALGKVGGEKRKLALRAVRAEEGVGSWAWGGQRRRVRVTGLSEGFLEEEAAELDFDGVEYRAALRLMRCSLGPGSGPHSLDSSRESSAERRQDGSQGTAGVELAL